MKNVKKLLKEHKSEILPDKKTKDNIKRELWPEDKRYTLMFAHGGERTADERRRNKITRLCVAALIIVLIFGALVPVLLSTRRKSNFPMALNKFAQITDADSFYAYGAASVGNILSVSGAQPVSAYASTVRNVARSNVAGVAGFSKKSANSVLDSERLRLAAVNRYMPLVENLLSEKSIDRKTVSGEYGYAFGMTVEYVDLRGDVVSYRLFYDKIPVKTDSEDDETKENYSITGVLFVKNAEYPVEGSYETEIDGNESESELCFKAFTSADKTSYIEARQKNENETEFGETETEREFVYFVYDNGVLVERTVIEYESEKDELELKVSISKNGREETLLFKSEEENGKRIFDVCGDLNGQAVRFRVYIRQEGYRYVFDDGSFSDFDSDDDDDDEEEDDDD